MIEIEGLSEQQLHCIPDVHFELIPIQNLVSSQKYQRDLSESLIIKAIKEFDVRQIKPVKVSRRDGINFVFDGQHTIEIVAAMSESRETPVWCMIYDDLQYIDEAHIFAEQQNNVKALIPYEMFIAHVEAGDYKQVMINTLVSSVYNMKISNKSGPGHITAVGALEFIYDRYGYEILDRTLRLALGTWEGERNSLTSCFLKAIAQLIEAYGDNLKDELFKEHVGMKTPKVIARIARERNRGTLGYAEVMLEAYNGKTRKRLAASKLLWNAKKKGDAPPDYEII